MTAEYWTDRKTVGAISFNERRDKFISRFDQAETEFSKKLIESPNPLWSIALGFLIVLLLVYFLKHYQIID